MATKALDPDPEFTIDAAPSAPMGGVGPRRPAPKRAGWRAVVAVAVIAAILGALAFHFLWPRDDAVPRAEAPTPPAPCMPDVADAHATGTRARQVETSAPFTPHGYGGPSGPLSGQALGSGVV